ncbi:extracellular solute-binding protein [Patescibacteria group bacterium]|nr:extracellular solute-binding protein [Patescibacteria group bacterium]
MNNQSLPKPSQTPKSDDQNNSGVAITPPPSALGDADASKPSDASKPADNKQGVVFDGATAKSRIPLAQKPTEDIKLKDDIALPPTSLSALSSMSSNTIPDQSSHKPGEGRLVKPGTNIEMPERTVLGKPIPQAIRGEELPRGLGSDVPSPKIVQEKSSSMPQMSEDSSSDIKKSPKPKFAPENKSVLKFLPFIVGGIILLAIVGFVYSKLSNSKSTSLPKQDASSNANNSGTTNVDSEEAIKRTEVPAQITELTYWGLWEPTEVVQGIISGFEDSHPGTKINYVKQSHKDYRERLQTALDSGQGPDIFRFHASWTPMLKSMLAPIPTNVISSKEFKDNYYPVVTDQLVVGGQYVGVPLMYDGLALYYNVDILDSANETPPATWAELRVLAAKLTVKSANGIERAGLAIGNTVNVDHFSDILAVLMLQNGASFNDPNSQETRDALVFYTNFILKDNVWNDKLPSSTVAFARGDVAMMFAPSWRAHEVAAQNPNLKFMTMTLPQLSDERIAWGSYWAEGVNTNSKNKELAAEFLGFISSDENLEKLFSKASEIRSFGEIYPKASMAGKLIDNEVVASYLDDAVYAQSWYLNSSTHDNGINDQMIKYYEDGINAILDGEDVDDVLITIEAGTKQVLKQYGISSK